MRILFTGFTPRGIGSDRLLYSYMSNIDVMKLALEKAGHEIDHRPVHVDETGLADRYDILMVAIAIPQSLSSRYLFGAMWAMEQFPVNRIRFTVDDWLLHQMESQLTSGLKDPQTRLYRLDNRFDRELALEKTDVWTKWFKFLRDEQYKLLLPAFPWARTEKLTPKLRCRGVIFDPSPAAFSDPKSMCGSEYPVEIPMVDPKDRERKWTLAAMRDVKPWLDTKTKKQPFTWPLEQVGNKRQGQPVLEEVDLLTKVYPYRWGIVGAPYGAGVAAGGGWRARYIHAALTHSILLLDAEEGMAAGLPYYLFSKKVEDMSTDELQATAIKQATYLREKTWSMDQLVTNLDTFVKEG